MIMDRELEYFRETVFNMLYHGPQGVRKKIEDLLLVFNLDVGEGRREVLIESLMFLMESKVDECVFCGMDVKFDRDVSFGEVGLSEVKKAGIDTTTGHSIDCLFNQYITKQVF